MQHKHGLGLCRRGDGDVTELAFAPGESQGIPANRRPSARRPHPEERRSRVSKDGGDGSGCGFSMRDSDTKLLELLRANAREPTASLARKLGLARSTVQERIARLEREGTIKGYTVRLSEQATAGKLRAVVMISTDPKRADRVAIELNKMPEVRSLSAVAGTFDLIATVETETPARIDALLDRIGRANGVARTVSSIVLSEKFSR
jgi:DNA-binding Lrp family transcriptional regulator